jgi:hypothetical protein
MKKRKTNKTELIKSLLRSGHSITSYEAFLEFGITRLSAIIHNLRHRDLLEIESEPIDKYDRFGNKVKFSKYYIK